MVGVGVAVVLLLIALLGPLGVVGLLAFGLWVFCRTL